MTKRWEADRVQAWSTENNQLSSPEGVLHTATTAMHYTVKELRGANDGTYAIDYSQVTKPESLILQRRQTITAPFPPPEADKASILVGAPHSREIIPLPDSRRSARLTIA